MLQSSNKPQSSFYPLNSCFSQLNIYPYHIQPKHYKKHEMPNPLHTDHSMYNTLSLFFKES